ncbi:NtaA/DmoA family FMN-dependent monooxygenase [Leifsonia sp. LS-T14]|uniref:NtaA/DmoA family FMN-dependent monooxygenase n=1 Tax=unclassified Leifsonia TaxID=2663824 RepID=UPI0035A5852D
MIAPAILAATRHLGVVLTASTTYEHPFALARRFSTLDHLSDGRLGWNVVTSYLPNAAANFGLDGMLDHDARYDRADEFLEVSFKLWEGSWGDGSFVGDRASGTFAHADRVRTIDHIGEQFRVKGPHLSPPSPQRTPMIFQAGWSARGKQFAARNSEVLFAGSQPAAVMKAGIDDVRDQAADLGRDPSSISFLGAFSVVTAPTAIAVQEKFDRLQHFHERGFESRIAEYAGWSGIDLSKYADDERIGPSDGSRVQHDVPGAAPTAGEIRASLRTLGADSPNVFIGTPDQVADLIEAYAGHRGSTGSCFAASSRPARSKTSPNTSFRDSWNGESIAMTHRQEPFATASAEAMRASMRVIRPRHTAGSRSNNAPVGRLVDREGR